MIRRWKRRWRPRHGNSYHEAYGRAFRNRNEHPAFRGLVRPDRIDGPRPVRHFIQGLVEAELEEALARPRYRRRAKAGDGPGNGPAAVSGHRHGRRSRSLMGT